jgi:hypothetical protein
MYHELLRFTIFTNVKKDVEQPYTFHFIRFFIFIILNLALNLQFTRTLNFNILWSKLNRVEFGSTRVQKSWPGSHPKNGNAPFFDDPGCTRPTFFTRGRALCTSIKEKMKFVQLIWHPELIWWIKTLKWLLVVMIFGG